MMRSSLQAGTSKTYNMVNLQDILDEERPPSWPFYNNMHDVQSLQAGTEWKYDEERPPSWPF